MKKLSMHKKYNNIYKMKVCQVVVMVFIYSNIKLLKSLKFILNTQCMNTAL